MFRPGKPQLALVAPVLAWLAGIAAFVAVGVEATFVEAHAWFALARVMAYLTALTVAAALAAVVALFGLGCGVMLWWLDDPARPGQIAQAVGAGLWAVAGYAWLGTALLFIDPPAAITIETLLEQTAVAGEALAGDAVAHDDVLALVWLARLRWFVAGAFAGLVAWRLSRCVKAPNAVLAAAFGAATVAAVATALGLLTSGLAPGTPPA